MRLWNALRSRLRSLFFSSRREADLREELQFHLERETERLEASGLSPDAARRQALLMFGGVAPIAEECRDARGTGLIDDTGQGHPLRLARVPSRPARRAHHRLDGRARARSRRGRVHRAQRGDVSGRRGAETCTRCSRCGRRAPTASAQDFTRAQLDALRRDTNVFVDAYGEQAEVGSRVDGRMMFGTFVTGNFFQVLGVNPATGRALTSGGRRAWSGASGDGPQPSRMGPAVRARPGRARPPAARQWRDVRNRRRDAGGLPRPDAHARRLLGAALDPRDRFARSRASAKRRSASPSSDG